MGRGGYRGIPGGAAWIGCSEGPEVVERGFEVAPQLQRIEFLHIDGNILIPDDD